MRNFTHRWPQSEHFFSKLGHFLPIFKKVQGRPPPPSPLITRVFSTLTYPSPSGIPLEFPIWIRPFPVNQKVVRYGYGKLEKSHLFITWIILFHEHEISVDRILHSLNPIFYQSGTYSAVLFQSYFAVRAKQKERIIRS